MTDTVGRGVPGTHAPNIARLLYLCEGGSRRVFLAWLGLTVLTTAAYCLPYVYIVYFGDEPRIAADVLQHVTWMQSFEDPRLFADDLAADYFRSLSPYGFAELFRAANTFGLPPLEFNLLLPILIIFPTTVYAFLLVDRLASAPVVGYLAAVFVMHGAWMTNILPSGTPRSFTLPFLLAFFYHLLRRDTLACLTILALQGLVYPVTTVISLAVAGLHLVRWRGPVPRLPPVRDLAFGSAVVGVGVVILLLVAAAPKPFGSFVTYEQARAIPAFYHPFGRTMFFSDDWTLYWLTSDRAGLLNDASGVHYAAWLGLFLPVLLVLRRKDPRVYPRRPNVRLLLDALLAGLILFFAAHLLLFELYLPSRYFAWSIMPIVVPAAGAIVLYALIRGGLTSAARAGTSGRRRGAVAAAAFGLLLPCGLSAAMTLDRSFPDFSRRPGRAPEIYAYLKTRPPDALTAGLSPQADVLPAFAARPVLADIEQAHAWHLAFYEPMRERNRALVRAYHTPDARELRAFLRGYGVDYLFVDDRELADADAVKLIPRWREFVGPDDPAWGYLKDGRPSALERSATRCTAARSDPYRLVDAACLVGADDAAARPPAADGAGRPVDRPARPATQTGSTR